MIVEVVTIVGIVILGATSVGGWVYTIRKNGRNEGKMQEQITSVMAAVNKLPCQSHPDFLQNMGALAEAVKNLEGWVKTVEGEQKELHKRIDNIVNKRSS